MAKGPEKKLTRAERKALNRENWAKGVKAPLPTQRPRKTAAGAPKPSPGTTIAADPETPATGQLAPVLSGFPPESYEPPAGAPPDERPADPEHTPTKNDRTLVQVLCAIGVTPEGIARQIIDPMMAGPISPATLKLHYPDELEHGAEAVLARVGAKAVQAALAGDGRMLAHVTKHFLGWGAPKPRAPKGFEATITAEAVAQAGSVHAKGLTEQEARAMAGGRVRVTLRLSDHITVKG